MPVRRSTRNDGRRTADQDDTSPSSSSSSQISSSSSSHAVSDGDDDGKERVYEDEDEAWQSAPSRSSRRRGYHHHYYRAAGRDDGEAEDDEGDSSGDSNSEEMVLPSPARIRRMGGAREAEDGVEEEEGWEGYPEDRRGRRSKERARSTSTQRRASRDKEVVASPRPSARPLSRRGRSSTRERRGKSARKGQSSRRAEGVELWPGEDLPAYIYSPTTTMQTPAEKKRRNRQRSASDSGRREPRDDSVVDLDEVDVGALEMGSKEVSDGNQAERYEAYFEQDLARRRREQQQQRRLERIRSHQQQRESYGDGLHPRQPPAGLTLMADPFVFTESVLLNYDDVDRQWDSPACTAACKDQPGVCCLSAFCCLTAPFFIIQERRTLLLHTIRSRYVCCLGAVPCCWPPAAVRPELYLAYVAPSTDEEAREHAWREEQRIRDGITSPNTPYPPSRKNKYPPVDERNHPVMPPIVSVDGVSAVGSVANIVNGLPQYGGYNAVKQPKRSPGDAMPSSQSSRSCSCCCGCCSFSPETNTCTLDYQQGCCLHCRHPTACCVYGCCPLCCLVTEACCCMPCATLGSRILIRRHYGFAPDRTIDDPVACLYSCCVTCLTGKNLEKRRQAYADGALSNERASCWQTFARSVASCLAATCCLWPCMCCSLAQQRDAVERRGYPQLSAFHPSDITGMA